MLANDTGAARLYSVGTPTGTTTQLAQVFTAKTVQGATISISKDGTISCDSTAITAKLNALGVGRSMEDSFTAPCKLPTERSAGRR